MGFLLLGLVVALAGCTGRTTRDARRAAFVVTDDAGVVTTLAHPASRVISLIPSVTDGILALGAADRLVGRSTTDRVPASLEHLPIVGDALIPSVEQVVAARPDLVVLWAGDKRNDLRRQLGAVGIATIGLAVEDTTDAIRSIQTLGTVLGLEARADSLVAAIHATLDSVRHATKDARPLRALFVVGAEPPLTVGPGTFIDQLLGVAGATNVFADASTRWPTVSVEQVLARHPEVVVLPGSGTPGAVEPLRALPGWRNLPALVRGCVLRIDADLASRPGPHMGEAAATLARGLQSLRTRCTVSPAR